MKDDNKQFATRKSVNLDFAQLSGMIIRDLNTTTTQTYLKQYTASDVERFIANPQRYATELGTMSEGLYKASPHFRQFINYYTNLPTLDYVIEPYGVDFYGNVNMKTFKNGYQKAVELVDLMNIKHEFRKVLKVAWIRDTFYGYQHISKDSFFIQRLPNDYCQISSIEDGVYNVSFDFQYFDRNTQLIETYPDEFRTLYQKYKNGTEKRWIELDSANTIVLKVNEEDHYDVPPFAGVFRSIYNIENYKALKLARETINNYKFIVQKIPLRSNSTVNNDFLLDLPTVASFHNKTMATLPDAIGLITTPFDVDTINFSKDKSESDNVQEAEREFYSSAGTSSLLFNQDNSSSVALAKSINVDEQEVFSLVRQIERIINKKLKNEIKGAYKFRVRILDTTIFNRKETIESYTKSAQYGLPVKMLLSASLGMTPSAVIGMTFLENDILELNDKFIPLVSSHTQSASDDVGSPEKDENELSDKGVEQRDREDNENRL